MFASICGHVSVPQYNNFPSWKNYNLYLKRKTSFWLTCLLTIQNEEAQVGTHLYAGFDKHFLQKCHYSAASMVQFIFIDPAGKIIELQAPLQSSNMEDFIKETIQD